MASDESSTIVSSSILDDDYEVTDDGLQYQTRHSSLSRLSVCTSSLHDEEDEDTTKIPSELGTFMSGLSMESFDGADADGEVSDVDYKGGGKEEEDGGWSDSDKEPTFYSLPATPSRRRRKLPVEESTREKDGSKCNVRRQRKGTREKRPPWMVKERTNQSCNSDGGGGGGGGVMVMTKARGGKRSLRMDMEEVKACRDLGFELEHERMMVPGRVSMSGGSTLETQTSSGGNSPVATWRISSPGDDPREVKARLKVWAQAVALASASCHPS